MLPLRPAPKTFPILTSHRVAWITRALYSTQLMHRANLDYVCVAGLGKGTITEQSTNPTIKDYAADHWVMFSEHKQLNADVDEWLKANSL